MEKEQVIGIDIGTSRCRAILFDITGRVLAEVNRTYPTLTPCPGWQEQDPNAVLQAFLECLKEIIKQANRKMLLAIGLSSYLFSILPVDRKGRPLERCLIWTDIRSQEEARRIREESDRFELYNHTGCPIHPMFPLSKIRWFREQRPAVFRRAHKFISMKEYIVHEVFGEYIVDWSVASGSGLFNIHTLQWDKGALELAGLEPSQLSVPASPLTRLPTMRPQYAAELGLADSTPTFVLGGADGLLSNIGAGAVGPHEADNSVGTGGAARVLVPEPRLDKHMRTFCLVAVPKRWAVGGVTAGGLIYNWFIQEFLSEERQVAEKQGMSIYELLERYAQSVPPGSEGLIFLPFLLGARAPSWNAGARGVLFGLGYHHGKKHFVRALMEGVTYDRFSAFKAVEEVVGGINSLRISGGFVHSPTWTQIMADIYGRELLIPSVIETSAFGAAFVAMLAIGLAERLEDVQSMVTIQKVIYPHPDAHQIYEEVFAKYQRLYSKVEDAFE